jgi:hypothetical protein
VETLNDFATDHWKVLCRGDEKLRSPDLNRLAGATGFKGRFDCREDCMTRLGIQDCVAVIVDRLCEVVGQQKSLSFATSLTGFFAAWRK